MKKALRTLIISVILMCTFSVTAFADMAPKPKITIKLENAPDGVYYMDLLAPAYNDVQRVRTPNKEVAQKYDSTMLQQLFCMADNDWYPVVSGEGYMTWAELTSDNGVHTFSYHPPSEFRVIIVRENGTVCISEEIHRKTFRATLTLDYNTMSYTRRPVWQVYPVQFISSFVPTIIIEFIVLLAFGLKNKENLKYFFVANFATQLGLNTAISTMMITEGWGAFLFGWITIGAFEMLIALAEAFFYQKRFTGCDGQWRFKYGIWANIASAAATLIFLQPMLDNMARIAGF